MKRTRQRKHQPPGIDHATFRRGDYGRLIRADGSAQWWVRSTRGIWMALSHQRVIENEDGTITLLYLKEATRNDMESADGT
jgi:hypothetical protein